MNIHDCYLYQVVLTHFIYILRYKNFIITEYNIKNKQPYLEYPFSEVNINNPICKLTQLFIPHLLLLSISTQVKVSFFVCICQIKEN